MKTIKNEFVENLKNEISEIDNAIKEFKKELGAKEFELSNKELDYSVKEIKNTEAVKDEIKKYKEVISNLETRKADIIKENSEELLKELQIMLKDHRELKRAKHLKERKKIHKLRTEAELLNEKMKQKDNEYGKEEIEFYREMLPYLDTEQDKKTLKGKVINVFGRTMVLDPKREHYKAEADYEIE